MDPVTRAISRSLRDAPLLAGDLPSAPVFNRSLLADPDQGVVLDVNQKLGHLYEQALRLSIKASPALAYLASHLQIFDEDKRTLGELDFILFDTLVRRHIHLELAVKFYLAVKTDDGWRFPGPNPKDSWQSKLDRLENHQLSLSQRPEARRLLHERFGIERIETRQLVYGRLFYPLACPTPPRPVFMAPDAQTGLWLSVSQWETRFTGDEDLLLIPKPLWPVELSPYLLELLEPVSADQLITMARKHCTMFTYKGSQEVWFLAPDSWDSCELTDMLGK